MAEKPHSGVPGISIIIPCYNAVKFIPTCVASIKGQSFTDFEVIIVNDGSTDDTAAMLEKECGDDGRFRIITKENEGPVVARFLGLAKMEGRYYMFCDIDDYLLPGALETLYTKAEETCSDVVVATFEMVKDGKGRRHDIIERENVSGIEFTKLLLSGKYPWQTFNKLFRRELFTGHDIILPREVFIGEDAALMLQTIINARRVTVINEAVYAYVQHGGSMMRSGKYNYNHFFECPRFIEKRFAELGIYDEMKDYIATFWLLSLSSASRAYRFGVGKDVVNLIKEKYYYKAALRNISPLKRNYIRLYMALMSLKKR